MSGNLSKYVYLAKNERTILTALQNGPVAVSISANSNFILYRLIKYSSKCYLLFSYRLNCMSDVFFLTTVRESLTITLAKMEQSIMGLFSSDTEQQTKPITGLSVIRGELRGAKTATF